ncbi:hypothetical protein DCC81_16555 [Chitinophaga parva]|uniref:Uncharacterized protein n=1 Tax=Chitinophaga parva TaxID=2169414 RepID=A0A2T7BHW6_9BACT|nr:hypothetical protein DCC81_16555 [Chitinophaga parva]
MPSGYQLVKNDNLLTYFKQDSKTGAYCKFIIYKTLPDQGGSQANFDFFWKKMVQPAFNVPDAANLQPQAKLKGWDLLLGTKMYNNNGVSTMLLVSNFSGENIMQNIVVQSNADIYKPDIESFIASVDVAREIKTDDKSQKEIKDPDKENTVSTKTDASAPSGNIKYEVWECNCPSLETGTLATTKLNTVVLSPNGKSLYYMPEKGLNGVTPENSNQHDSWGNVTDKGNMLSLVNDKYGKMELYKINATSMSRYLNSKSSVYKKIKPVDGLRFDGAYSPELSYYNGKTDVISKQIDPNKRPIIFFKKDGTYINEGIAFSNITYGDDYAIGKGTYEIINFSLILSTQSGRKLQVSFTPVLDANPTAVDNPGFIINNNIFYRLNRSFTPHN